MIGGMWIGVWDVGDRYYMYFDYFILGFVRLSQFCCYINFSIRYYG